MMRVTIPSCLTVETEAAKSYTVYIVELHIDGRLYSIEKRYREFHELHKQLKKLILTPVFPPKRVRNLNQKALEQRRKALEYYLQAVIKAQPSLKPLYTFFGVRRHTRFDSHQENSDAIKPPHQPIIGFKLDPFVTQNSQDNIPDMVIKGVMKSLYSLHFGQS